MSRILLTRPKDESLPLAKIIEGKGHEAVLCPMMVIEPCGAVPSFVSYDALAFTSAAAVRVFAEKTNERRLICYCVGDNTYDEAKKAGFSSIYNAKGDALALFNLILEHKPNRILYLSGKNRAFALNETLSEAGVVCDECVLYEACGVDGISESVMASIVEGAIDYVLFYSARTAQLFLSFVKDAGHEKALCGIKALCLSKAVLESAEPRLWNRTYVSAKPDGAHMMALLDEVLADKT